MYNINCMFDCVVSLLNSYKYMYIFHLNATVFAFIPLSTGNHMYIHAFFPVVSFCATIAACALHVQLVIDFVYALVIITLNVYRVISYVIGVIDDWRACRD